MELTGNVSGLIQLFGGGSDITIQPILLEGVEIMEITVDGVVYYIYAPEPGDDVSVTPIQLTGTKIATITIGENNYDIYSPGISVTPIQLTGTKIATININGTPVDIYSPNSNGINYSTNEQVIGEWIDGKPLYRKTLLIHNESIVNSNRTIANISTDHQVKHFKAIAIELGVTYYIPYVAGNGNASIYFRNTGEVEFSIQNTSFSAGSDFYITYEYTKASDV